ncbi:kinetochore-associated Ndc80 complex subunit spc25 [Yamadazyma tenuis]|uniref:Kinetochore protein SPC25 n=1 Tax=Candida tenuis (strain ATCC 10573 / BCRC 21748 / CBS 615 / JCM 9827 / NBRC 10315 / NRRL Y-1498 / VKM Y-70) TaxID=590646 RepID=G3AX05_CANTC|nr:uncharacterized protein CANTEDRAFT_100837 [Yamadazyma tenuis ATCC 10573]EGV66655.1 hypothetical protein CANTEDRAFT_100837 [Yamadazyma tenuis ATCC 10573]WEJ95216.1 kinetochore-associated Ndc80 complex subunit spc25 [Yamadazyma tenuis]
MSAQQITSPIEEFFQLQKDLDGFTSRFTKEISSKKRQIIDDKTSFNIKVNDLKSEEVRLTSQINQLDGHRSELQRKIEESIINFEDRRAKIDELHAEETKLNTKKLELDEELNGINNQINEINNKIEKLSKNLEDQVVQDDVELVKFERYLGLRIEVLKEDLMKFRFSNLDASNLDKEFWIDLNIAEEFQITGSFPAMGEDEMAPILVEFNQSQNFGRFLKQIRQVLKSNI